MTDHVYLVSAFSLRPGSVIAVIGGNTGPLGPSKDRLATKERQTEDSVIGQIQTELSKIRKTIAPLVEIFLVNVGPSPSVSTPSTTKTQPNTSQSTKSAATSSTPTPSDLEQEHLRLGELLLQSLLRFDLINMDGEWVEARKERKLAIKEVQSLLDKLDSGWKSRTLA